MTNATSNQNYLPRFQRTHRRAHALAREGLDMISQSRPRCICTQTSFSKVFSSNDVNWLDVTKLLWSTLQQIKITTSFFVHAFLQSTLSSLYKFSTLHKYHPDQHLRDLSTERWREGPHPPPMRTTALFSSTATAQEPYPLALSWKVGPLSLPGGRRESWWEYREVGFKNIGNNY